jgi:hypothetical protein
MSGKYAYTALPAVVTPLVYPPDWNPNWDFPAVVPRAYPPGYTPEFSIVATGANFTTTPSGINISSILYDHGTYTTNEPSVDSEVIVTAFIDGVSHKLRFSGDITFLDAIACSYSEVSGFWGTDSYIDVDFDMSGHGDKTLTFVVAGVVEGQIFTDTVSMGIRYSSSIALPLMSAKGSVVQPIVSRPVWTCEFDATPAIGGLEDEYIMYVVGLRQSSIGVWESARVVVGRTSAGIRDENDIPTEFSTVAQYNYSKITELPSSSKILRHFYAWSNIEDTLGGTLFQFRTYLDGVLQYTNTKILLSLDQDQWLTFNSETGVVIIYNP